MSVPSASLQDASGAARHGAGRGSLPGALMPARGLLTDPISASMRPLFAYTDLDETRMRVGQVMKPHRLDIVGRGQRLNARMHHVSIGEVGLSRLRYGADVEIEPGPLDDFFLVQMPLTGRARIRCGGETLESTPECASVLSPTEATTMHWASGNDQLMVRLTRSLVERTLAARLGRPLDQPIRFQLGLHWRDAPAWSALLRYLLECAAQAGDLGQHPLIVAHLEQLVAATLLSVQPHDQRDARPARCTAVLPRHVRRAQEHIEAHADEPLTADQLARIAGVSTRSLYSGFSTFIGTSPMNYLRDVRLNRVRAELLQGQGPVGAVALRWGFAHAGRFSADYRKRFGETPTMTLRG